MDKIRAKIPKKKRLIIACIFDEANKKPVGKLKQNQLLALCRKPDTEEAYSFIDGVRNNLKAEKDEPKSIHSIKDSLKSGKESIAKQDKETSKLDKTKSLGGDER